MWLLVHFSSSQLTAVRRFIITPLLGLNQGAAQRRSARPPDGSPPSEMDVGGRYGAACGRKPPDNKHPSELLGGAAWEGAKHCIYPNGEVPSLEF